MWKLEHVRVRTTRREQCNAKHDVPHNATRLMVAVAPPRARWTPEGVNPSLSVANYQFTY